MITVSFFKNNAVLCGFSVEGHSGYAESGADIVCAGITSAVGYAVCLLTEVLRLNPKITVEEKTAKIACILSGADVEKALAVLIGLQLHITALSLEYDKYITVFEKDF